MSGDVAVEVADAIAKGDANAHHDDMTRVLICVYPVFGGRWTAAVK